MERSIKEEKTKMAVKLKKIPTKIMMWSAVAYLVLLYLMTGYLDIMSALAYTAIAVLTAEIAAPQVFRWDYKKMFLLGAIVSVLYHVIGIALNEFSVSAGFMVLAGLQQGILTAIVYKIGGGKR